MASYVYSSQREEEPILMISSSMNIGDHDGGDLGDIYAFTNCDYIELYKNHEFIKMFSPSKTSALKHPPIVIDDFIGDQLEKNEGFSKRDAAVIKKVIKAAASQGFNLPLKEKASMAILLLKNKMTLDDGVALFGKYYAGWGQSQRVYTFKGFKDKKQVIEVERGPFERISLQVEPSKTILTNGETYDVALVSIKAMSNLGEVLPYHDEVITLSVTGNLSILGPMTFALSAGRSGFYVRSHRGEGSGIVTINTQNLGCHEIEFKVHEGEHLHL
jgi:beta-galactosidase